MHHFIGGFGARPRFGHSASGDELDRFVDAVPQLASRSSPLRHPAFRALWVASVCSYTGTWIQDVGQTWLMLSLTGSALQVALLSASTLLPALFLTLPAGVIADRVDRRRVLLVGQVWMALVAAGLAALTWAGLASPAVLLAASAALGVGAAMTTPSWLSLLPDLVERHQIADAVMFNSVAINIARAVGPALGALAIGAGGVGAAFLLNALSFLAVIEALRHRDAARTAAEAARHVRPREPLRAAALAAFQRVRGSPDLQRCHAAVAMFAFAAAGVTALLPTFARRALGAQVRGYGALIAGLGVGAVLGASVLPRLRSARRAPTLVASAMTLYGLCILALGPIRSLSAAVALLVPAGMGWLSSFATLNALVQLHAPAWVKSRILALYQMAFVAAWSAGATAAGALAEAAGVRSAMTGFACVALVAAASTAWLGLPGYDAPAREPLRDSQPPPAPRDPLASPAGHRANRSVRSP